MKKDIHPNYHTDAKIVCMCGNTFTVGSTSQEIHVEICSNCHPLYTGEDKVMDMAGRVERFKQRFEKTKVMQEKTKKAKLKEKKAPATPKKAKVKTKKKVTAKKKVKVA